MTQFAGITRTRPLTRIGLEIERAWHVALVNARTPVELPEDFGPPWMRDLAENIIRAEKNTLARQTADREAWDWLHTAWPEGWCPYCYPDRYAVIEDPVD